MSVVQFDLALDLFPLAAALLASVACGVLGNFLVLRRLSLMGDAISHSVLPGLVIAFIITASRSPVAMFIGAAAAGMTTVVLVELVKRLGRVEPGAAMGVVFSVLFALGVLLIESGAVHNIDLDADCVLHGQLETLAWFGAPESLSLLTWSSFIDATPRQVWVLMGVCVSSLLLVAVFFKELRLAAFDPALATSMGFNANVLHYGLMLAVAAATVASFEAVGSILVIAMLVCPAATARLLTDRLQPQVIVSVCVALLTGVAGYLAATSVPLALGLGDSVNAAGSITVMSGVVFSVAVVCAPRHGVLSRHIARRRYERSVAIDNLLASLYRAREQGNEMISLGTLSAGDKATAARGARAGLMELQGGRIGLTSQGLEAGADVVRRHRTWEVYLVERVGLPPDHVHETAEHLEHLGVQPVDITGTDPHGRPIPAIEADRPSGD